jgi:hypothetical protein
MIHYLRRTATRAAFGAAALLLAVTFFVPSQAQAQGKAEEPRYKPFVHAYNASGSMEDAAAEVRAKLTGGGFTIVGEHAGREGVLVIAVTSDELLAETSKTDYGTFAAAQRVSLTAMGADDAAHIQVAYTDPVYIALAYRMDSDLAGIKAALAAALGEGEAYGSKKGLKIKKLKKYRYMGFPMNTERFNERDQLASYGSYAEALEKVEAGLAAGDGGVTQVYRIDIPGKEQTLFGVAMTTECSGDEYIMTKIDFRDTRSSAHLPYEMLVTGGKVEGLGARFRIAISFPDLSMMGSHSFAGIMCAPGDIKDALRAAAGNPDK